MKIKTIEKKDGKLMVTVAVSSIEKTKGRRILVTTNDVEKELEKQNIKFGSCEKNNQLWNTNPAVLSAVWIFDIPSSPRKKTPIPTEATESVSAIKKPTRASRTSRKIKKSES